MKPRTFWVLVILFILAGVVIVAAAVSRSPSVSNPGKVCTITINSDIGLQSIKITNYNTGSTWYVLPTELPYSFNCTSNDQISFNATANEGYRFNYWLPSDGKPQSSNPYMVKVASSFAIAAKIMLMPTETSP